jgi:hypothetical protein
VVHKKYPIKMIHFVLNAEGCEVFSFDLVFVATSVLSGDDNCSWPLYGVAIIRDA